MERHPLNKTEKDIRMEYIMNNIPKPRKKTEPMTDEEYKEEF